MYLPCFYAVDFLEGHFLLRRERFIRHHLYSNGDDEQHDENYDFKLHFIHEKNPPHFGRVVFDNSIDLEVGEVLEFIPRSKLGGSAV